MIAALRTDLEAPEMRALLAINTHFGGDKNTFMPNVVDAQKAVAYKDAKCVYVDTATAAIANSGTSHRCKLGVVSSGGQ